MINDIEIKNNKITKILQRIGLIILVIGLYAGLCVLFYVYSEFKGVHQDIFIASAICYLFGLLYVIIPFQFFKAFYKFGALLLSKSIHGLDPVSEKKAYKPFKITFIIILILSYILLGISILINVL